MRRWPIAAAVAGLALALAGVAFAAFYQNGSITLTAFKEGVSTGIKANLYSGDRSGKAPWVTKTVTVTFPKGTKFNLGQFKACTLSDSQIEHGSSCPSASKVGTGSATATTDINGKAAGSFTGTVSAYVRGVGKMIEVVKTKLGSTTSIVVINTTTKGNVLAISVPPLKFGAYPIVLTSLTLNVKPKLGTGHVPLIKAGECVKNQWVVKTHFVYTNGKTKDLKSSSFCS
jgi:hypothetical protein